MPYPNNVLAAWQLVLIAVVAVGTLSAWLGVVFWVARPARHAYQAAASAAAAPDLALEANEPEPAKPEGSRKAA